MAANSLLTIKDASDYLSVSEKTLRRWEKSGKIISIRTAGGHRRYSLSSLKEFKSRERRAGVVKKYRKIESPKISPYLFPPITRTEIQKENELIKDLSLVYKAVPRVNKKIFKVSLITLMLFILAVVSLKTDIIRDIRESTPFKNLESYLPFKASPQKLQGIESLLSQYEEQTRQVPKVLAATSFQNVSFNVFIESNFRQDATFSENITVDGDANIGTNLNLVGNSVISTGDIVVNPGGGGLSIGGGTATIDLTGGDLYVTDELEVGGDITAAGDADISGDVSAGSLTINAETFTDLTGAGLTNAGGVLTTTMGSSIESSEITDGTIQEVDLNVSNSATNAYVLTYNSSTGGFTWAVDQTGGAQLWTDGGAITYLTSTTDDLALGGTDSTSPFFFDVSGGNLTITGTLAVNGDTITADGATLTINAGGNVDIQDILNVDSLTTDTGGVTIASGQDLTIGTVGLNDAGAGPTSSGASLVGTFDEFTNSNATNVQDVLDDLDAAIAGGATGDITAVGDILTGAAFTETAGGDGNSLWFEGTTSDANELELTAADVADDTVTVTLPAITGTLASLAGTQIFTGTKTFNDLIVADTDISFSGASTTFTVTGAISVNPGGTMTLGDGGDAIVINGTSTDIQDVTTVDSLVTDTGGITILAGQSIIPSASGTLTIGNANLTSLIVDTTADADSSVQLPTNSISGTEILDGTIEEVDLEVTNSPTDNYILTFDLGTGGFTWVDPTTAGTNYWDRVVGVLSPINTNDAVAATSSGTTVATFTATGGTNNALIAGSTGNYLTVTSAGDLTFSGTGDTITGPTGATFTIQSANSQGLTLDSASGTVALATGDDLSIPGGDITGANGAAIDIGEATSGDITFTGDLIVGEDAFIGLSSTTARFVFDSTPTPDEIDLLSANLDINSNDLLNIGDTGTDITSTSATFAVNVVLSSDANEGISGGGLTDCDTGTTSKLLWDVTTNKFSCGVDQGAGAGSSKWSEQNNLLYPINGNTLSVAVGTQTEANMHGLFTVTGTRAGRALAIFNDTGTDQNILTASASGTTVFNLNRSGNLQIEGTISDLSDATLTVNDALTANGTIQSSGIFTGSGATTYDAGGVNQITIGSGDVTQIVFSTDSTGDSEIQLPTGSISGTEILDGTIEEVDLEVTNSPTDNYILTFDLGTGGFTWVDPTTAGTNYWARNTTGGANTLTPLTLSDRLLLTDGSTGDTTAFRFEVNGNQIGKALAVLNDTDTDQDIFVASQGGSLRFAIENDGDLRLRNAETIGNQSDGTILLAADTGALTLSLSGTSATLSNTSGNLTINSSGNLDIDDGTIDISTQATNFDLINTNAAALTFETNLLRLDTTNTSVEVTGTTNLGDGGTTNYAQFTSTGDLTFVGSADTITGPGSGGLTMTNDTGSITITTSTSGDITIGPPSSLAATDDLFFQDGNLTGSIPLSLTDTSLNTALPNAIVDAINEAYDAGVGGGSGVWGTSQNAIFPNVVTRRVGIGTTNPSQITSSFFVTNASSANSNALVIFGQTEATYDIFAASSSGTPVLKISNGGNLRIGTNAPDTGKFNVTGAFTGKALAIFDETGNQNIITASASGVTVMNLDRSGNLSLLTQGDMRFYDSDNSNYSGFQGPSNITTSVAYTLPDHDASAPSADYVLTWQTGNALQWKNVTAVGGAGDITDVGSFSSGAAFTSSTADDDCLGLTNDCVSGTAARIEFDDQTVDEINILNAKLGVGRNTPDSLFEVYGTITGKALATFDDRGTDQNIITASASGTTVFNLTRDGLLQVAAGQGIDTLAAGTLVLGNTTATTVSIGGTAATTLNLGAGGALTRTFNIGTGTGADTINIGTGATTADDINLGGLATSTIDILGVTSLGTPATNYTQFSADGDISLVGTADTINKVSGTLNLNTTNNQAITTGTGLTTLGGDATIQGGDLTLGINGTDGILTLYSEQGGTDFSVVFQPSPSMTETTTYTLPPDNGAADNYVLTTDGTGVLNWEPVSGAGGVTGTGTANRVTFWTGTSTIDDNADFVWDNTNELLAIGTNGTATHKLEVSGAVTGKALVALTETGDQNILTASASGTTVLNLDRSGNLSIEGYIEDLSGSVLNVNDDLKVTGNDIIDSGDTTRITLGDTTTLTNTVTTLSGTTTVNGTSVTAVNLGAATVDFNGAGIIQYANGSNFTIRDDGPNNIFFLNGSTDAIQFGNATDNNTYTFLGTGLTTLGGNLTVTGADITGLTSTNIDLGEAIANSITLSGTATGTSATFLGLPVKTDSGDPTTTQTNGAIYYNSNTGKFRCYENGAWTDCITASGTSSAGWTDDGTTVRLTTASDFVAIGAATADGKLGVSGTRGGQALVIFNDTGTDQNILTASASGTTVLNLARTGAVTIDPTTTGTFLDFVLDTQWTSGTLINADFGATTTQGADADITGLALNLNSNLTTNADADVTGFNLQLPALTSSEAVTTTYTGYNLSSAGNLEQNTVAGTINWRGLNLTTPNISIPGGGGTINASGIRVANGGITTGGTQNAIQIAATGVGAGTLNGILIDSITGGSGTENAINIAAGWERDIRFADPSVNILLAPVGGGGQLSFTDADSNTLCTVTDAGSTGNLTCTGNITGATTGTVGYWTRTSGGVLHPETSTDDLAIGGTDSTANFFVSDAGVLTFNPDGTGTFVDFDLDAGTTDWTSGDLINADFDVAAVQTGIIIGIDLDFNTNFTGNDTFDFTGVNVRTPGFIANDNSTTNLYGYRISSAGALNTSGATATNLNWYGAYIQKPNINTGDAADTTTSTGLWIAGGTVSAGTGIENNYGLIVDANAGNVGIGTTSPDSALELSSVRSDTATNIYALDELLTLSGAITPATVRSTNIILNDGATTGTITTLSGLYSEVNLTNAGGATTATNFSAYGTLSSTGNVGDWKMIELLTPADTGGGAITNLYGLWAGAMTAGTNNAGAVIGEATGTNQANLVLGQTSIPTGSYSIYNSSTDQNYFAGKLGIGTESSPEGYLEVDGAAVGQALVQLNETGDQNIFVASRSGETRFTVGDSGQTGGLLFLDPSGAAPTCGAAQEGQIYNNASDDNIYYCDGTAWRDLTAGGTASGWTDDGTTVRLDTATDFVAIGANTADGKLGVTGARNGQALVILNEQGDQNILSASASSITQFNLTRTGTVEAGDLTLGLDDTDATITTYDTEDLTIDPASTGNIILTATTGLNITDDGVITDIDDTAVTITDDLAVNGPTSADITSTTTTASLFDATVTTLNIGAVATSWDIGASGSGTGTINNATTAISGILDVNGPDGSDFAGGVTFNDDVTLTLAGTEHLAINSSVTTNVAVNPLDVRLTHNIADGLPQYVGQFLNVDDGLAAAGTIEAVLAISNNDQDESVSSGILFGGGTFDPDFTTGINFSGANFTNEIVLENQETISNQTNQTIQLAVNGSVPITLSLSGTAATISNTAGDLTIDAAGGEVLIAAGDQFVLGSKADPDPTGVNGGMYYNTTNNKFKCFENSTWVNCIAAGSASGWTDGGETVRLDTATDFVAIGANTADGKLGVTGQRAGQALAIFNYQGTDQNIIAASMSGTTRWTLGNDGAITQIPTTTTGTAYDMSVDSITEGTGLLIDNAANTLTTGTLLQVQSSATSLTTAGDAFLGYFNWSGSGTATGDLFRINIGSSGNVTNLFNVTDGGSSLFRVAETQIESAVPHSFTAAGDVTIAYDLLFTNQTASYIKSNAPLYIQAGESFESNNLTLNTYNSGIIHLSPATNGEVLVGTGSASLKFTVSDSFQATAAAMIENQYNGSDADGLAIKLGYTGNGAVSNRFITFMRADGLNVGRIAANTGVGVTYETTGVDFAEYFTKAPNQSFETGEIVVESLNGATKSNSIYQPSMIGIVSEKPGFKGGEEGPEKVLVGIEGQVPVKVSQNSAPIRPGDFVTSSSVTGRGMKATQSGRIIGIAMKSWDPGSGQDMVEIFLNNSYYLSDNTLNANGDIKLTEDAANPGYKQLRDKDGNLIDKLSGLTSVIVGNIKAGAIETEGLVVTGTNFVAQNLSVGAIAARDIVVSGGKLIADSITAGYGEVNQLVSNSISSDFLTSKSVKTKEIAPLEGEKDIVLKVGQVDKVEQESGKLLIQNQANETVASVDEVGNARFAGDVEARRASFSGELAARKVVADEIESPSIMSREEIEKLLAEAEVNQTLLADSQTWTATSSASLNELALENLYVTGTAAINSLSVTESIVLGSDLVFSSAIQQFNNETIGLNSIDTLAYPLNIQSSAAQPLLIMAGLVQIDTQGNVQIAGNLAVGGTISASGLKIQQNPDMSSNSISEMDYISTSGSDKLLSLTDSQGQEVAGISASGSAEFKNLKTDIVTLTDDPTATSSATFTGLVYNSNASAGTAKVPASSSEVTIKNPNIKSDSLVFVTPTTGSGNYVLYVKSQNDGEFKVGFDLATEFDVSFNWWIVELAKQANAE